MGFIKLYGAFAVLFMSILGILRVFEYLKPEEFDTVAGKGLMGLTIFFLAAFALSTLLNKKKTTTNSPTKNGPQF